MICTYESCWTLSFEAKGYVVQSVPDGTKAMEILPTFAPDLVMLDILLPHEDGFATCQKVRAVSNVPVIIFSALNSPDDIERALTVSGADDYVIKPCAIKELEIRIEALLRRVSWQQTPPETLDYKSR